MKERQAFKTIFLIFGALVLLPGMASAQWAGGGTPASADEAERHYWPKAKAGLDGTVFIAWPSIDTLGYQHLNLTKLDKHGAEMPGWPANGLLAPGITGLLLEFDIAVSPAGEAMLVWESLYDGSSTAGLYTQKFNDSGDPLWNNGDRLTIIHENNYNHRFPFAAADNNGGLLSTWMRYDTTTNFTSPDVFVTRINEAGEVDPNWGGNNGIVPIATMPGVRDYYPLIAYNSIHEQVYVTWYNGLIGESSLHIQSVNVGDGSVAAGWPADGVTLSWGPWHYPLSHRDHQLFCNSLGEACLVYAETKYTDNGEIYFHKINHEGVTAFGLHGRPITLGEGTPGTGFLDAKMASNDELLITWNDFQSGYDTYISRVDMEANKVWDSETIHVAPLTDTQYPKVAPDGAGGAYCLFRRSGNLYVVRYTDTGAVAPGFTAQGMLLGPVSVHDGFFPEVDSYITAIDNQSAVAVWNQRPSAETEQVLSCNVQWNGTVCGPFEEVPVAVEELLAEEVSALSVWPNPAQGIVQLDCAAAGGSLRVLDLRGRSVFNQNNLQFPAKIDLSFLPQGLYLCQIWQNGTLFAQQKTIIKP